MKRIIAAIVCALMVFSFTGCGGNAGGRGEPVAQLTNLSSEAQTLGEEAVSLVQEWMAIEDFQDREDAPQVTRMEEITEALMEMEIAAEGEEADDIFSLWIALMEVRLDMRDYYFDDEIEEGPGKSIKIVEGKLGLAEATYDTELGYAYPDITEEARRIGKDAIMGTYDWLMADKEFLGVLDAPDTVIEDTYVEVLDELEKNAASEDEETAIMHLKIDVELLGTSIAENKHEMESRELIDEDLQRVVEVLGLK